MKTRREDIPVEAINEIDFMLGSIEECKYLIPVLKDHGIDPDGGWVDIDTIDDDVIVDIYDRLLKDVYNRPKYWVDLSIDDIFILTPTDIDDDKCYLGVLSEEGISLDDPDWEKILEAFFEKEYGIKPEDWE